MSDDSQVAKCPNQLPQQPPSSPPSLPQPHPWPHDPSCSCSFFRMGSIVSSWGGDAAFLRASRSIIVSIATTTSKGPYLYVTVLKSSEVLQDPLLERPPRHRADHLVDELPVLEEQEGRDPHHAVFLELLLVLVAIDLREQALARVLPREVVDHRGDRVAWAAPFRPEVYDDVLVLLDDLVKVVVRDMNRLVVHGCSLDLRLLDQLLLGRLVLDGLVLDHEHRTPRGLQPARAI